MYMMREKAGERVIGAAPEQPNVPVILPRLMRMGVSALSRHQRLNVKRQSVAGYQGGVDLSQVVRVVANELHG